MTNSNPRIMRYPKSTQTQSLTSLFFTLLALIFAGDCFSQVHGRSNYFLNVQASTGTSKALGSFSKNSSKTNEIGKYQWSFGINLRVDAVFKNKYTFGLAIDYDFCVLKNDYLNTQLNQKFAPKKDSVISGLAGNGGFDMIIERYSLSASKIYQKKNFVFQPKIYLSLYHIIYSYDASYIVEELEATGGQMEPKTYTYSSDDAFALNLVPELNVKYIILKKTWLHLAINFGLRFTYVSPKFRISEEKRDFASFNSATTSAYTTVKDPVLLLNGNLGVQWLF